MTTNRAILTTPSPRSGILLFSITLTITATLSAGCAATTYSDDTEQLGWWGDTCADNGWYDDGQCDLFCPHPDPDCDGGGSSRDVCARNGWYGDGQCDLFCPQPDSDCRGSGSSHDVCARNGWYGDGQCDLFCPYPDSDCN